MTGVGDGFARAFKDPAWPGKMLVQGLIVIIPIIGWIAMTGWLMMAFENVRAGKNELPPAGFHLERGIGIFLVFFVYGLVLDIPGFILGIVGQITTYHASGPFNPGAPIIGLSYLWFFAASLFLRFLEPSLIVNTYHGGIGGGFDIKKVWRLAISNPNNSIAAGLTIFVASIIGGLGFVCCIGIIFTIPYENVITAAAAAWFEKEQSATPAAAT